MRYPPDNWDIYHEDVFATHSVGQTELSLTADVLVQVSRAAKLEGCFKILLGGNEMISTVFPAKDVLIMGGAASFTLTVERWPKDLDIKVNTMTSEWIDIEESIADGTILVNLTEGGEDTNNSLRRRLRKESTKTQNGGAIRWAIGAAPNGFLELQLQVTVIQKNYFFHSKFC